MGVPGSPRVAAAALVAALLAGCRAPEDDPAPATAPSPDAPGGAWSREDEGRWRAAREAAEAEMAGVVGDLRTSCRLRDVRFEEAVAYFAGRHRLRLVIDPAVPRGTRDRPVSMGYADAPLAAVLVALAALAEVEARAEGDGIRIVPRR